MWLPFHGKSYEQMDGLGVTPILGNLHIYIYIWRLFKIMVPENALTPRLREPFAPFRAPAESGHEIMIRVSFTCTFINNGIQTFREPYAALSRPFATAAKHTHPYLQMSLGY